MGRINLQFQNERHAGDRQVHELLVAQVDHQLRSARAWPSPSPTRRGGFAQLLHGGMLALMVEPSAASAPPRRRWCRSRATRLSGGARRPTSSNPSSCRRWSGWRCAASKVAGFLLQRLPPESAKGTDDDWHTLRIARVDLTRRRAARRSDAGRLLRPPVRRRAAPCGASTPRTVSVRCNCNRAGISRLLLSLGREEVDSILAEQSAVEVTCEFCGRDYELHAGRTSRPCSAAVIARRPGPS